MQYFVPLPCIHLIINTYADSVTEFPQDRASKLMLVMSLCNSLGWFPSKLHKHKVKSLSKIHCYLPCSNVFLFSNNFSFARVGPLTNISSEYRAGCGLHWLSLTQNQLIIFSVPVRSTPKVLPLILHSNWMWYGCMLFKLLNFVDNFLFRQKMCYVLLHSTLLCILKFNKT